MAMRKREEEKSECLCNGRIPGASNFGSLPDAKGELTFSLVLHTRKLDQSAYETKQMTTAKAVVRSTRNGRSGTPSLANHEPQCAPTASAYRAGNEGSRWARSSLQRLLTHSYSGKVLAVDSDGKMLARRLLVWRKDLGTPEKKARAVHEFEASRLPLSRFDVSTSRNRTAKRCGARNPKMKDRAMQALHLLAFTLCGNQS